MRKDTLYITLSRDITSYTITSGQRAIATNVNYAVTIESPTLTTNLAGRDVSVIIYDTEGNTLTTATTFYPDTKNPYKAVTGSLLLDGAAYAKFFDGKPVDTAVRLPIVIRDKSATLLSSDIVVMNGGENAEPSSSDETVAGLVNAIRFYDLVEFKAWLDGTKTRDDGLRPTDIVVGQWVHTQNDGSFICKELIGAEPSVAKNFTAIVTQFPLTGTLKMNPDNGVGLSVYSGDVYNEAEATSFSTNAITYKGEAFTFNAGDNQIARQKDNYALENRVNSTMKSTLDAVKADNDETYAAMLPVMNTTVEARDRAETAARGAKASETRAITAETNASASEQNAEASKKSAAVSEANAGLYRQQALAYAQKAETEATTSATKATEASTSASEASVSAGEALAHKNDAGSYAEAARLSAEASAVSANSSATSAANSKSSADIAAQSETIAVGSAEAAASSANIAIEYKDAALSSATNAATSATNAATSAKNAATSSASASNFASGASDSAKAAATSAADLAEAVATANSFDGRLTAVENGLSGCVNVTVVDRSLSTGVIYPSWYGTAGQLGVPSSTRFTSCGLAEITLWKNGRDYRNINMLVVYYYDESAGVWKVWGRSETLSSNPSSAYPDGYKYTFHFMKDGSAPWLTVNTKVFLAFKQNTDATFGKDMIHLAMHGRAWNFGENGYGVCSGWPNAAGEATGIKNQDWCRAIGYFYVDAAGTRVDTAGTRVDTAGARLDTWIDAAEARIKTIEDKGLDYKKDLRVVPSDSSPYPLVKTTEGPYSSVLHAYGRNNQYVYANDSYYNYLLHLGSGHTLVYDRRLKFVVALKAPVFHNGSGGGHQIVPLHNVCCAKLYTTKNEMAQTYLIAQVTTAYDSDYYGGEVLTKIVACDRTSGDVVQTWAPFKFSGLVDGDYFIRVGFLTHNALSGHYVLFGYLYRRDVEVTETDGETTEKAVNTSIGTGYFCFTSDMKFVKYDGEGFVESDTFDLSYWTPLTCSLYITAAVFRPNDGRFLNTSSFNVNHVTVALLPQSNNSTNGLYYFGKHDDAIPLLAKGGEYYTNNNGVIPLAGGRLSCDSGSLNSTYYPAILYQHVMPDSDHYTTGFTVCNGVRFVKFHFSSTDPIAVSFLSNTEPFIAAGQFGGATTNNKKMIFTNNLAGYTGWTGLAVIDNSNSLTFRGGTKLFTKEPLYGNYTAAYGLGGARETQYALHMFHGYEAECGTLLTQF